MLEKLEQVLRSLPEMLDETPRWDSLIVNRRKPATYRVFTLLADGTRVCLHRFEPCHLHEAFSHPHPWPGAFAVLAGCYKMTVGYSVDRTKAAINDRAITLLLPAGSRYEILDPQTWHSVVPLTTTYTVMINGKPWAKDAHAQVRTTQGKDLDKLSPDDLAAHLNTFRYLICNPATPDARPMFVGARVKLLRGHPHSGKTGVIHNVYVDRLAAQVALDNGEWCGIHQHNMNWEIA